MSAPPELGFDLSINLGNVMTMAGAIAAIVWKASSFEGRLDKADALRIEEEKNRTHELTEIKNAISEMKGVVTIVAVQKERIDNQSAMIAEDRRASNDRLARLEKMVDDVRHGKGLVREAS